MGYRLFNEESGQAIVEYGFIFALLAVVLIGAILALNGQFHNIFR